jgi:DNA-binding IclR family transcriptional regulator
MTRSSPSVERVVAVLNFFADHPDEAFTLTDLIRALRLSRATCHALLASLVEAGYLHRASDKAYLLGPRLAAVGRAAAESFSPLTIAKPEMRRLADEYDVVCSAVFREGHDIVVKDRAASKSHLGYSIDTGTRLPLRPPFGGIFLAFSPDSEVEAWLDTLAPPASHEQRAQMMQGIIFARANGFQCVTRFGRDAKQLSTDWLFHNRHDERPVNVEAELTADGYYAVSALTSPVFDERGSVAFVLTLAGFTTMMSGDRVAAAGLALRETCLRISGQG